MSGQALLRQFDITSLDYDRAGEASARIKRALRRLGIGPDVLRRVSVAAYEAEMNLVIHSLGGKLSLAVDKKSVTLTAEDRGPGIRNIEKAMRVGYSTADDRARDMGFGAGMGLPNIRRNADEFHIDSVPGLGTRIEARFML